MELRASCTKLEKYQPIGVMITNFPSILLFKNTFKDLKIAFLHWNERLLKRKGFEEKFTNEDALIKGEMYITFRIIFGKISMATEMTKSSTDDMKVQRPRWQYSCNICRPNYSYPSKLSYFTHDLGFYILLPMTLISYLYLIADS